MKIQKNEKHSIHSITTENDVLLISPGPRLREMQSTLAFVATIAYTSPSIFTYTYGLLNSCCSSVSYAITPSLDLNSGIIIYGGDILLHFILFIAIVRISGGGAEPRGRTSNCM